ncbi:unnamed protein product [Ectocarpus sp. 6 AP-2014]
MIRKIPSIFYSGMNSSSGDSDNNFINNKRSNRSNREKLKTSILPRKMTIRNALLVTTVLLATTTIAMNTQQAISSDGPTTEVSEARRATATAEFVARGMDGSWGGGSWGSSPKPDKRSLHKALSSLRGSSGPLSGAGDTAADMNPMHKILNQMIQSNIRGTSPTAKAMARLELAVKKYFLYGGLNPWNPNTAGVECASEMTTCTEDTGENGCHECFMALDITGCTFGTIANTDCPALGDSFCCAFGGVDTCSYNPALVAYVNCAVEAVPGGCTFGPDLCG